MKTELKTINSNQFLLWFFKIFMSIGCIWIVASLLFAIVSKNITMLTVYDAVDPTASNITLWFNFMLIILVLPLGIFAIYFYAIAGMFTFYGITVGIINGNFSRGNSYIAIIPLVIIFVGVIGWFISRYVITLPLVHLNFLKCQNIFNACVMFASAISLYVFLIITMKGDSTLFFYGLKKESWKWIFLLVLVICFFPLAIKTGAAKIIWGVILTSATLTYLMLGLVTFDFTANYSYLALLPHLLIFVFALGWVIFNIIFISWTKPLKVKFFLTKQKLITAMPLIMITVAGLSLLAYLVGAVIVKNWFALSLYGLAMGSAPWLLVTAVLLVLVPCTLKTGFWTIIFAVFFTLVSLVFTINILINFERNLVWNYLVLVPHFFIMFGAIWEMIRLITLNKN